MIRIVREDETGRRIDEGICAILVPLRAREEPGFLRMLPGPHGATAKHDFHQLTQLALLDHEDGALAVETIPAGGLLEVHAGEETIPVVDGLVLLRRASGAVIVLARGGAPVRALLSAAHRFCTRWIRLDVR